MQKKRPILLTKENVENVPFSSDCNVDQGSTVHPQNLQQLCLRLYPPLFSYSALV
jgi:hypothetical protein